MNEIDSLRIEIIGNKDLKYKLLSNETFIVDLIDRVEQNCSYPHKIINELMIMKFLLKFNHQLITIPTPELVRLNHGLVEAFSVLVNELIVRKKYDSKLMLLVVELLNLLSMTERDSGGKSTGGIDRINDATFITKQDDYEEIFKNILVLLQLNEYELLINGLDLIPNIINSNNELIIIQQLLKRLNVELVNYSHQSLTKNFSQQSSIKLIYKLILNLNYILNQEILNRDQISLSQYTIESLESLIKLDNKLLTLNIINLLNLFDSQKLYLHKLIDLIEFNNYSINSFKILCQLIKQDFSLINELIKLKIDIKLVNYLNTNITKFTLEEFYQVNINDVMELLSLLTSNNEEFRINLINYEFNFKLLIHKLVKYYKLYLLKLVHELKTSNATSNSNTMSNIHQLVSVLNNSIFTNTLCLIRSLSRSITVLRTFFIDCKIVDNLIDVLKIIEILNLSSNFNNKLIILSIMANLILDFSSFRYNLIYNDDFFKNFLLIYTNNKSSQNTIDGEQLNLIVLQVIKNLMYNENENNKIKLVNNYFQLSLFLPYLNYNKTVEDLAIELEGTSTPSNEVTEIHNMKLAQKLTSFDVLRNLSTNSNYFNQSLSLFISENLNINWDKFLIINMTNLSIFNPQFSKFSNKNIINLLINDEYTNLILSINYIENHKFLSNLSINLNKLLLKIWLNFLKLTPKNFKLSRANKISVTNNLNSIKLSIIWILNNLTWQNNLFNIKLFDSISKSYSPPGYLTLDSSQSRHGSLDHEQGESGGSSQEDTNGADTGSTIKLKNLSDHYKRATYLKKFGFLPVLHELNHQLLLDLNKEYNSYVINDLIEKIKTVVYQFDLILSPHERKKSDNLEKPEPSDNDQSKKKKESSSPTISRAQPQSQLPSSLQLQAPATLESQPTPVESETRRLRDVNRGGEGFGYDSDDYIDADADVDPGTGGGHSDEFLDDRINLDSSEDDDNDDYWVR